MPVLYCGQAKALGPARITALAWGGEASIEARRGVVESPHAVDNVPNSQVSVHKCPDTW